MALLDSTPTGTPRPGDIGWVHLNLAAGESVAFRYRLHTHGLAVMAVAAAVAESQTFTSDPFPIGTVASPPKILPIPHLAPVP